MPRHRVTAFRAVSSTRHGDQRFVIQVKLQGADWLHINDIMEYDTENDALKVAEQVMDHILNDK